MNTPTQPSKTFQSVTALPAYPENIEAKAKNAILMYSDSTTGGLVNYNAVSAQVARLQAQLTLAQAVKDGLAALFDITS